MHKKKKTSDEIAFLDPVTWLDTLTKIAKAGKLEDVTGAGVSAADKHLRRKGFVGEVNPYSVEGCWIRNVLLVEYHLIYLQNLRLIDETFDFLMNRGNKVTKTVKS